MGILTYILLVVFIGFAVYAVNRWTPIDQKFKTLILWAAVIFCVLVLLYALGVLPVGWDARIPQVR